MHGPVTHKNDITKKSLAALRKLFPTSKIIFSTWKDSDLTGLDFDEVVENEDPGASVFNIPDDAVPCPDKEGFVQYFRNGKKKIDKPKCNNVNRMILSVQEGLKKVDSKYVLKIRSDIILKNKNFLKYWDKFPAYNGKYKIFEHRIIMNSTFAQFAHVFDEGIQLLPFHMSDWLHFGLTKDVSLLFSCPLQDSKDASNYWDGTKERKQYEPFECARWRYPAEPYILYSLVSKYFPEVRYEDSDDYNVVNMTQSNLVMADNFIVINAEQFSFSMEKYVPIYMLPAEVYYGFITYLNWQYLYKIYCDKNYKFWDFDILRFYFCFFSIKFMLKYPKRHFLSIMAIKNTFRPETLRKAFCINEKYEEILE